MTALTQSSTSTTFPVDKEHSALRMTVVASFFLSGILGFFLISALVPGTGINLLAILGAFVIAAGVTALIERVLRSRWPSGRMLQIDSQGVRLVKNDATQQAIQGDQTAEVLLWHFQTKRRSRVPKGWHVLACALEQGQDTLSTYTVLSPGDFKNLSRPDRFRLLQSRKDDDRRGMNRGVNPRGRDDLLLAGEQRRLLQAESRRWQEGVEMTPADFTLYLEELDRRFPEWRQ